MITKRDESGNPELVAGIVFDVTEQKRMEQLLVAQNEQLLDMTKTDYLTGIYNRRALHEALAYELRRVERSKVALSVVLIDVDNFKSINDTYGHLIGDEVLMQVAEVLKKSTRTTDIIGRFGGEEFLVILPDCNLANGMMLAEKIRADIQDAEFTAGLNVTISAGVNEYEDSWVDHLLQGADQAMVVAKQKGKNQVAAAGKTA
jgi:diguanylate cyclase (GGDEF)-like protein